MTHLCLDELIKKWERPVYVPKMFNRQTGEMTADKWAISMYNLTPSGKPSGKDRAVFFIDFCPMCGERLEEVTDE